MTFATVVGVAMLQAWSAAPRGAASSRLSAGGASSRRPLTLVHTAEREVAITFDACATRTQTNGFDRAVLEVLKREAVPATIFVSGRWVEAHPAAMTQLAESGLLEFGNHSYDHPHM